MPAAAPLDSAQVVSLGLMLADGKPGPFRLDLLSIDFEPRTSPAPETPGELQTS